MGEAAAAGNDDGGLRQGVPLRRGLHRRRGPGGGAGAVKACPGFTAGSVSVRIRGAAESCALAESLRRTAERLMAPFAVPDDFCFRGVRG